MSDIDSVSGRTRSLFAPPTAPIHVLPRVDNIHFQAEIPPLSFNIGGEAMPYLIDHVKSYDNKFQGFIQEMRILFESDHLALWNFQNLNKQLESDDNYLSYVQFHDGDVAMASFHLACELSCGKEHVRVKKIRDSFEQYQKRAYLENKLELLFKQDKMLGSYESSINNYHNYNNYDGLSNQSDNASSEEGANGNGGSCATMSASGGQGVVMTKLRGKHNLSKQDVKKKWLGIQKTAMTYLDFNNNKSHDFRKIHNFLYSTWESLPCPNEFELGESCHQSIQECLSSVISNYILTLEWIADVLDECFFYVKKPDLSVLKRLASESSPLPYGDTAEETQLRKLIFKTEKWVTEVKRYMLFYDCYRSSRSYDLVEDGISSLHPISTLQFISVVKEMKRNHVCPAPLVENMKIFCNEVEELESRIDHMVNQSLICAPHDRRGRVKRLVLSDLEDVVNKWNTFPLLLCGGNVLQDLLATYQTWKVEAQAACNGDENSDRGPSLKTIEKLISDAESFPIDMTEELDELKGKRNQAKLWLEKLKKSIFKGNRSTRKTCASGVETSLEKVGLSDMKKLVQEGEIFFDDAKNKELSTAVNIVDVAEEWINRVKEIVSGSEDNDLEYLKELLSETDDMPVMMEEALMLRVHIEALEWSIKIRPHLQHKSAKVSTLQKYFREIQSIRNQYSSDITMESIKLPEELKLEEIIEKVDAWNTKSKKLLHSLNSKSGVTLVELRSLKDQLKLIDADMEVESRKIRQVVGEVEEWLTSSKSLLFKLRIPLESYTAEMEIVKMEVESPEIGDGDSKVIDSTSGVLSEGVVVTHSIATTQSLDATIGQEVAYEDLNHLHETSKSILVDLPEIRALRIRFKNVCNWLEKVRTKFVKKLRRSNGNRSTQRNSANEYMSTINDASTVDMRELQILLKSSEEMYVDFSKEKEKMLEIIRDASAWEEQAQKEFSDILNHLHIVLSYYCSGIENMNLTYMNFPFLKNIGVQYEYNNIFKYFSNMSTFDVKDVHPCILHVSLNQSSSLNQSKHIAFDENKVWKDFNDYVGAKLCSIYEQGAQTGVNCNVLKLIELCLLVIVRCDDMRNMLSTPLWGDIMRSDIKSLKDDISHLLDMKYSLKSFSSNYENSIIHESFLETSPCSLVDVVCNNKGYLATKSNEMINECGSDNESDRESETEARSVRVKKPINWKKKLNDGGMADDDEPVSKRVKKNSNVVAAVEKDVQGDIPSNNRKRRSEGDKKTPSKSQKSGAGSNSVNLEAEDSVVDANEGETTGLEPLKITQQPKREPLFEKFDLKNSNSSDAVINLPLQFKGLIDFWYRWVILLERRLDENDFWNLLIENISLSRNYLGKTNHPISSKRSSRNTSNEVESCDNMLTKWQNITLKVAQEETLAEALRWCSFRAISSSLSTLVNQRFMITSEWTKQAEDIIENKQKLDFESFSKFIKSGENTLLFVRQQITVLKDIHKKAKAWIGKYEKLDMETASTDVQKELVEESNSINVDLSLYVDPIKQGTEVYCLCREPYYGLMIACDTCNEWYHGSCLGLTRLQAERCDKFICVRCTMEKSILHTSLVAASTVNMWVLHPESALRNTEVKLQKIIRQIVKEEKNIQRLEILLRDGNLTTLIKPFEKEIQNVNNSIDVTLQANVASAMEIDDMTNVDGLSTLTDGFHSNSTEQPSNDEHLADNQNINAYVPETISSKVNMSYSTELAHSQEKIRKMRQEESGVMKLFSQSTNFTHVTHWMSSANALLRPQTIEEHDQGRPIAKPFHILPTGVNQIIQTAKSKKIYDFEDVFVVCEYFRWISWCYQCIYLLREPPSIKQLADFVNVAKSIQCADERIVKVLQTIHTRAVSWKAKAKKLMSQLHKGIDATKAFALVVDGNGIPFRCRLKDAIKFYLIDYKPNELDVRIISGNAFDEVGGSGRKNSKKLQSSINKSIVIPTVPSDSDSEDDIHSDTHEYYFPVTSYNVASMSENLWPPKLPYVAPQSTMSSVVTNDFRKDNSEVNHSNEEKCYSNDDIARNVAHILRTQWQ